MSEVLNQLREAGYGIRLDDEDIGLEFHGEGDPDASVIVPLISELKVHKAQVIQCLRVERSEIVVEFEQVISAARDWLELDRICEDLTEASQARALTETEVENLVERIVRRSSLVPEEASAHTDAIRREA